MHTAKQAYLILTLGAMQLCVQTGKPRGKGNVHTNVVSVHCALLRQSAVRTFACAQEPSRWDGITFTKGTTLYFLDKTRV